MKTFSLTVNANTGSCGVYFNASSPLTYPTPFIVYTNCTSGYVLQRNGTGIANASVQSLAVGVYNFSVIRTDQVNYSNIYDAKNFEITAAADTTYPQFNNFIESPTDPATYNQTYLFNTTVTFTNGTVGINFNGVNYSMSNLSSVFRFNKTNLAVGTYNYYYWGFGNGSSHLYNQSSTMSYTIAQNTTWTLDITASPSFNTNNATSVTLTGIQCPTQLTCSLFVDGAGVANPYIHTYALPAVYNVTFNTTGNANYSAKTTSNNLTIIAYVAPTPSNGTSININTCRYKKLAYYNIKLAWSKQTNCL
jgi:hypothetical protein